jgi:molybdenum cofactor cytidylyltransferase
VALVLAAGTSTRMGEGNKLLARVGGRPMVRRVVEELAHLPLAGRIVVTGADAPRVTAALAGLPVRFVHNAGFREGIASSIRAGVAALPEGTDGVLIVLGDMPWVGQADVEAILEAFDPEEGRGICVPVHGGRRGNPVLWAARYFHDLRTLSGDTGARGLFRRFAADLHEVTVPREGVLLDVDTPEALEAARARRAARDG